MKKSNIEIYAIEEFKALCDKVFNGKAGLSMNLKDGSG